MFEQDVVFFERIKKERIKRQKIINSGNRLQESNLMGISRVFDEYYFLTKLQLYCAYLSHSKIINPEMLDYSSDDFLLIREIIHLVETNILSTPQVQIYNQLRKLFEKIEEPSPSSDTQYQNVLGLINDHAASLTSRDLEEIYSFLANYCIRRLNKGEKHYGLNYFLISIKLLGLQYQVKKKKKKILPGIVFRNMIVSALKLKESSVFSTLDGKDLSLSGSDARFADAYEWIEAFMKVYAPKLDTKEQKLYVPYCQALVAFDQRKFARAYKVLKNPLRQRGVFVNMNIKVLNLKIIYEINATKPSILAFDEVEVGKVLEAFRGLLRDENKRKNELNYQIEFYTLFEKLFRKLFRLYNNYQGLLYNSQDTRFVQEKKELKDLIEKTHFPYKKWFLEKLEEIK